MNKLTLFINSCDDFSDCWPIFFHFLDKYFSTADIPVVLNTERKEYETTSRRVLSTKVAANDEPRLPWSRCLDLGLEKVSTDYVLYVQEDYFLNHPTDFQRISDLIELMEDSRDISAVFLNKFGPRSKAMAPASKGTLLAPLSSRYLTSLQGAIWRKDQLRSLIKPWESAWAFEILGTIRARSKGLQIRVDNNGLKGWPALSYVPTAIIKGCWNPEVIPQIEEEGLKVDFSKRGFYQQPPRYISYLDMVRRLPLNPILFYKSIKNVK